MPYRRSGFSLVEILIVVVLLGILAAIVVPRFADASNDATESALCTDTATLRRQINLYRAQHAGRGPHLDETGSLDKVNLSTRLTARTDAQGKLAAAGAFGPYLKRWPTNGFCEDSVAGSVTYGTQTSPPRDDTSGWYYNTDTSLISPNSATGATAMDPATSVSPAVREQ